MSTQKWNTGEAAKSDLRVYEQVLDEYHKSLPFFRNLDHSSVFFLLGAFDSLVTACQANFMPHIVSGRLVQPLKSIEEGLSIGLSWISRQNLPGNGISPRECAEAFRRAGEFLNHSINYADLQDMHISCNRGLVGVESNPSAKTIRFQIDPHHDILQYTDWIFVEGHRRKKRLAQFGFNSFKRLTHISSFIRNQKAFYRNGRVVLEDPTSLRNAEYFELFDRILDAMPRFIDDNDELGGFCGSELRSFWIALLMWSYATLPHFVALSENGAFQHRCLPTQSVPKSKFLDTIGRLSNVSQEKIQIILDRMTLGANVIKRDVFLQPFVANNTHVCWSIFVILNSSYQRNMLKLMARSSGALKHLTDNLVGGKERSFLGQVGRVLSTNGYQFKLMSKYKSEHAEGEVDLIAYHTSSRDEVLIVEGKTVLAPDEINEVDSITTELIAAQQQLCKSIEYIRDGNGQRIWNHVDWESVRRIYGIVLTPQTTPNPRYDFSEFPCGTLELLKDFARARDLKRPSRIWQFFKDRPWLPDSRTGEHGYREITVGEITYLLPEWQLS